MAKAASSAPAADAPLEERARWVLDQLRKQPGVIVTDEEGRWLKLEHTASLTPVVAGLFPGQTMGRIKGILQWLGTNGLRRADVTGRGSAVHFILLPDEDGATPAAADAVSDDVLNAMTAAANKIQTLKAQLASKEQALLAANVEIERLTAELTGLRRRETTALRFSDGVAELHAAIGED